MKKMITLSLLAMIACNTIVKDINKAMVYLNTGNYALAAKKFESTLPELIRIYGNSDTTNYSKILFYTAISYFYDQKFDKAEKYLIQGKEIYEAVNGRHDPWYGLILLKLAGVYHQIGQYENALSLYFEVLENTEKALGKVNLDYSTVLSNLALLYFNMGQYEKALSLLLEALEIEEKVLGIEHPEYNNSLNNLASLYTEMGQFDEALALHMKALSGIAELKGKMNIDYATSLHNLGQLYKKMGQLENSLPLLFEAIEIKENTIGKEHPSYARTLTILAETYLQLKQYENSLPLLLEAKEVTISTYGKSHLQYAIILNNLALLYSEIGQYEKSLPLYLEALDIIEKTVGKEHSEFAKTLNNMALLLNRLGQNENALSLYFEALQITLNVKGKLNYEYVGILNNLAITYRIMGNYEESLPFFLDALEINEMILGKEHPMYAVSLNSLAASYSTMGQFEKALPLYLETVEILEKVSEKEHPYYSTTLNNLALLYSYIGQYEKTLPLIQESLETSLFNISQNFTYLSENEKNQYFNTIRPGLLFQQNFFYTYSSENPSVGADAFNLELATKGMILQSGIQMRLAILNSGDGEALRKFDEWIVAKASLAKQYSLPIAQRSVDLKEMELRAEKLESELTRLSNTFKEDQSIGSIKWQDVQQQLGENDVAIEFSSFPYYDGKRYTDSTFYTANVLRPGDEHPHLIYLCEQRQLDSLLYRPGNTEKAFIDALYRGAEPIETSLPANGQRLYELIWKPIAHLLPEGATVYFAPAGSLHQIAHAAIPVGEDALLLDKYKLVQLSTTAALLQQEDQNKTLTGEIVLFGGIQYTMNEEELLAMSSQNHDINNIIMQRGIPEGLERSAETWSYLPGTLTEVEAIGKLASERGMEVTSYTEKEALEERFKELSGKNSPTILHIATHGFFFPDPKKEPQRDGFRMMDQEKQVFRASDNPLYRAGLLFAGANLNWQGNTMPDGVDDGILTAWEATNVTLMNTRLVTLSACETGLGEVRGSEGVFGLQRAFKAAGAEYLLMSLWKVPDHETAEFMTYFYARLFEGSAIPDAFHATQHHMKTQYPAEPYKWAAFVLTR